MSSGIWRSSMGRVRTSKNSLIWSSTAHRGPALNGGRVAPPSMGSGLINPTTVRSGLARVWTIRVRSYSRKVSRSVVKNGIDARSSVLLAPASPK